MPQENASADLEALAVHGPVRADERERPALYGHTGGTPGYVTFAAGSRDASRFFVVHWNGMSSEAIGAMDEYLDELICEE